MYKTVINVKGMACGMCEAHINDAIRKVFDVKKVVSSHKKGTTEIISNDIPDNAKLKETIEQTGYDVLSVTTNEYEKKGFSLFKR